MAKILQTTHVASSYPSDHPCFIISLSEPFWNAAPTVILPSHPSLDGNSAACIWKSGTEAFTCTSHSLRKPMSFPNCFQPAFPVQCCRVKPFRELSRVLFTGVTPPLQWWGGKIKARVKSKSFYNLIPNIYGSHRWLYKQNLDKYQSKVSFSLCLPFLICAGSAECRISHLLYGIYLVC